METEYSYSCSYTTVKAVFIFALIASIVLRQQEKCYVGALLQYVSIILKKRQTWTIKRRMMRDLDRILDVIIFVLPKAWKSHVAIQIRTEFYV